MYESIQHLAAQLSTAQCIAGLVASLVAVKLLGTWTSVRKSIWTGPLNLIYLVAILALLFFTHATGTRLAG